MLCIQSISGEVEETVWLEDSTQTFNVARSEETPCAHSPVMCEDAAAAAARGESMRAAGTAADVSCLWRFPCVMVWTCVTSSFKRPFLPPSFRPSGASPNIVIFGMSNIGKRGDRIFPSDS